MIRLILFSILLGIIFSSSSDYQTIDVDGVTRFYKVFVPSNLSPDVPHPVLFVLHGGGGNAAQIEKDNGFDEAAQKLGFVAVYPEGNCGFTHKICVWNALHCCVKDRSTALDDVRFLDVLIPGITKTVFPGGIHVDPQKLFMTGHSNGAMMTLTYGFMGKSNISRIAPVSGAIGGRDSNNLHWYLPTDSQSGNAINVLHVHGRLDSNVHIEGGETNTTIEGQKMRIDLPQNYSIDYWNGNNQCKTVRNATTDGPVAVKHDMNGHMTLMFWSMHGDCARGTMVRSLVVENGQHLWDTMDDEVQRSGDPKISFCRGSETLAELIWNLLVLN